MASGGTRFPVVLVGSAYWSGLISWLRETVQADGKIHPWELDLIQIADDPDEVVKIIQKAHAEAGLNQASRTATPANFTNFARARDLAGFSLPCGATVYG